MHAKRQRCSRGINSNGSDRAQIGTATTTTYDDTSAVAGTTYYYWVVAINAGGDSGFGSSDSGFRAVAVPAAPTNVQASDGAYTDKVRVTWSASDGATSYKVFRNNTANSTGATELATTGNTVLSRQCLNRRIADKETLRREVAAWEAKRNQANVVIDWQFTTADARIKLKRLYPVVKEQNST